MKYTCSNNLAVWDHFEPVVPLRQERLATEGSPCVQTTNLTFVGSGNDSSLEDVGRLIGEVAGGVAAAAAQGACQAVIDLAMMSTIPVPTTSLPLGVSYCQWLGVVCCIAGELSKAAL